MRRGSGAAGLPTAGYDVRLVDPDDNEVGSNEIGELLVRPQRAHSVFEGYWGLPEKTAEAFRGLWYRTGDLLRRDDDGYFFFVARKSETIRHRGYMISPSQIEDVVRDFEGVLECAAVGISDERGEDEIKLLLVPKTAQVLDPELIRRRCEEGLPAWMVPRYLEIRANLPKTPTQKVESFKLREEGLTSATRDLGPDRAKSEFDLAKRSPQD